MKKLTAGIFTVMLGLVAVDANAAITSKKYVDDGLALKADKTALAEVKATADGAVQTTDFTTFQTTNTAAIADAKKAGTDAADALDAYKDEVTTALVTKQNTLQAASISGNDAAGNVIAGISAANGVITVTKATVATAEGLEELEGRVDTAKDDITTLKTNVATNTDKIATLNGDATTEGSVAKAIADEITRANGAYDAKGDADAAQAAAIAAAKTETTTQVSALANGQVKTNTDAIAAINNEITGIAATAKNYTDTQIAAINTSLSEDYATTQYVNTEVGKKQNTLTPAQLSAVNSGITAEKVTAYDGLDAKITTAQTQADKGVADAVAAQAAADAAQTTADAAIANFTATGGDGKYVLTAVAAGDQTSYKWELIERGVGE